MNDFLLRMTFQRPERHIHQLAADWWLWVKTHIALGSNGYKNLEMGKDRGRILFVLFGTLNL